MVSHPLSLEDNTRMASKIDRIIYESTNNSKRDYGISTYIEYKIILSNTFIICKVQVGNT